MEAATCVLLLRQDGYLGSSYEMVGGLSSRFGQDGGSIATLLHVVEDIGSHVGLYRGSHTYGLGKGAREGPCGVTGGGIKWRF